MHSARENATFFEEKPTSRLAYLLICRRLAAEMPVPTGRGKRGQGHHMVPLPPFDSPKPSLAPRLPSVARRNGGLRELGSVRFSAYMWLSCPEFSLRQPPRMTVRGQTVQGGSVPLRKALLRSSGVPWSTKRPCGPLAFRRATEGSRVLRKGWRVKRGRETLVSLPLLPPPPGGGNAQPAHQQLFSPPAAHRCIGGRPAVC